jgi:hypothetical protein
MTLLEAASLKKASDLEYFRNPNSDNRKPMLDQVKKCYGPSLANLLDGMLQANPVKRKKLADLDEFVKGFLAEADVETESFEGKFSRNITSGT